MTRAGHDSTARLAEQQRQSVNCRFKSRFPPLSRVVSRKRQTTAETEGWGRGGGRRGAVATDLKRDAAAAGAQQRLHSETRREPLHTAAPGSPPLLSPRLPPARRRRRHAAGTSRRCERGRVASGNDDTVLHRRLAANTIRAATAVSAGRIFRVSRTVSPPPRPPPHPSAPPAEPEAA